MRNQLTLPNLLRVIGALQTFALWAWGLAAWAWGAWRWTLATLLITTALIAVELWLENTKEMRTDGRSAADVARDVPQDHHAE